MEQLTQIPEWLGYALSGILGWAGKSVLDWWRGRRATSERRCGRLQRLTQLLEESGNLFVSQRAKAERLRASIAASQPSLVQRGRSYDAVFSEAFPALSPGDLQIHAVMRAVTETAVSRVNQEMLQWLHDDDWFKRQDHSSQTLIALSRELRRLELHLSDWQAKFSSVFKTDPSMALCYLADEDQHGTGFPTGIERVVNQGIQELS